MHIYNIFTFNLVIVQETEPNVFGRDEYERKLACRLLIVSQMRKMPKGYALLLLDEAEIYLIK